jgi:hypothetical protein
MTSEEVWSDCQAVYEMNTGEDLEDNPDGSFTMEETIKYWTSYDTDGGRFLWLSGGSCELEAEVFGILENARGGSEQDVNKIHRGDHYEERNNDLKKKLAEAYSKGYEEGHRDGWDKYAQLDIYPSN